MACATQCHHTGKSRDSRFSTLWINTCTSSSGSSDAGSRRDALIRFPLNPNSTATQNSGPICDGHYDDSAGISDYTTSSRPTYRPDSSTSPYPPMRIAKPGSPLNPLRHSTDPMAPASFLLFPHQPYHHAVFVLDEYAWQTRGLVLLKFDREKDWADMADAAGSLDEGDYVAERVSCFEHGRVEQRAAISAKSSIIINARHGISQSSSKVCRSFSPHPARHAQSSSSFHTARYRNMNPIITRRTNQQESQWHKSPRLNSPHLKPYISEHLPFKAQRSSDLQKSHHELCLASCAIHVRIDWSCSP